MKHVELEWGDLVQDSPRGQVMFVSTPDTGKFISPKASVTVCTASGATETKNGEKSTQVKFGLSGLTCGKLFCLLNKPAVR